MCRYYYGQDIRVFALYILQKFSKRKGSPSVGQLGCSKREQKQHLGFFALEALID
jgi:hypothetical protein